MPCHIQPILVDMVADPLGPRLAVTGGDVPPPIGGEACDAPTEEVGPYDNILGSGDVFENMRARQALLERRFARLASRAPSE